MLVPKLNGATRGVRVSHSDSDAAQAVEQDVARLEVVVDDSSAVLIEVGQPLENLGHDDSRLLLRQHLQKCISLDGI